MQNSIRYRQGRRFIASPYLPGVFIREDIFRSRFIVQWEGDVTYRQDGPALGTYSFSATFVLSRHGSIEEAAVAAEASHDNGTDPLPDGILSFCATMFSIHDAYDRLVLAGDASSGCIGWIPPAESDLAVGPIADQARALRANASAEASWDNFDTAARLRRQASLIEGRLVDPFWRDHARAAIATLSATS